MSRYLIRIIRIFLPCVEMASAFRRAKIIHGASAKIFTRKRPQQERNPVQTRMSHFKMHLRKNRLSSDFRSLLRIVAPLVENIVRCKQRLMSSISLNRKLASSTCFGWSLSLIEYACYFIVRCARDIDKRRFCINNNCFRIFSVSLP